MSAPVRRSKRVADAEAVKFELSQLDGLIDRLHHRYVVIQPERCSAEVVAAAASSWKQTVAHKKRVLDAEGVYEQLSERGRKRVAAILDLEADLLFKCGVMEMRLVLQEEDE